MIANQFVVRPSGRIADQCLSGVAEAQSQDAQIEVLRLLEGQRFEVLTIVNKRVSVAK